MVVSKDTEKKAHEIFKSGKVNLEVETDKRLHFKVKGETEVHSVIFDKDKNDWKCDCRFGSLKEGYCSHIKSCILLLTEKK